MYSPDESGLHAALGAFFLYGRGCVVSSRKVNFRYVPVAIGAAVAARKFNGFHRSLGLSCFRASSPFRKPVSYTHLDVYKRQAVMEALDGLPPVKVHCSLLAEEAIHAALWDYAQKNGITIEGLEKPKDNIEEEEEEEDY